MGAQSARKPGNSEQPETYPYPRLRPMRPNKATLKRRQLFEEETYKCTAGREAEVTDDGVVSATVTSRVKGLQP